MMREQENEGLDIAGLSKVDELLSSREFREFARAFACLLVKRFHGSGETKAAAAQPPRATFTGPASAWDAELRACLASIERDPAVRYVTVYDVLTSGLGIDPEAITKTMATRVGIALRRMNWNKVERRLENPRYVYERPQKSAHDTAQAQPGNGSRGR